ncbi:MAG: hypothetical protein JOS17DRAFT_10194 [Linnemannia elongata]|nr:MAG: hypothetical protein JOS17DRAFT_10194 [Linnemannia elongata]
MTCIFIIALSNAQLVFLLIILQPQWFQWTCNPPSTAFYVYLSYVLARSRYFVCSGTCSHIVSGQLNHFPGTFIFTHFFRCLLNAFITKKKDLKSVMRCNTTPRGWTLMYLQSSRPIHAFARSPLCHWNGRVDNWNRRWLDRVFPVVVVAAVVKIVTSIVVVKVVVGTAVVAVVEVVVVGIEVSSVVAVTEVSSVIVVIEVASIIAVVKAVSTVDTAKVVVVVIVEPTIAKVSSVVVVEVSSTIAVEIVTAGVIVESTVVAAVVKTGVIVAVKVAAIVAVKVTAIVVVKVPTIVAVKVAAIVAVESTAVTAAVAVVRVGWVSARSESYSASNSRISCRWESANKRRLSWE